MELAVSATPLRRLQRGPSSLDGVARHANGSCQAACPAAAPRITPPAWKQRRGRLVQTSLWSSSARGGEAGGDHTNNHLEEPAPLVGDEEVSFTLSDLDSRALVSFSENGAASPGLQHISRRQSVSMNIATLSSFEEGELLADGGISSGRFVLEADEVQELQESTGLSMDELLLSLVSPASTLARPPISLFHVGAVGLGASGRIYVGVNLEFRRLPLACSVHAEQFLIVNMLQHGETALETIAVSAAPCGHCRQFYSELGCADGVRFLFCDSSSDDRAEHGAHKLDALLPRRFKPQDLLGTPTPPLLLEQQDNDAVLTETSQGIAKQLSEKSEALARAVDGALEQARRCYAPYSRCFAGLSIVTEDEHVYSGGYLESAAYNPSLPPLQAALAGAVTQGMPSYQRVVEVVLVERDGVEVQHDAMTKLVLHYIAPNAKLHILHLRQEEEG